MLPVKSNFYWQIKYIFVVEDRWISCTFILHNFFICCCWRGNKNLRNQIIVSDLGAGSRSRNLMTTPSPAKSFGSKKKLRCETGLYENLTNIELIWCLSLTIMKTICCLSCEAKILWSTVVLFVCAARWSPSCRAWWERTLPSLCCVTCIVKMLLLCL